MIPAAFFHPGNQHSVRKTRPGAGPARTDPVCGYPERSHTPDTLSADPANAHADMPVCQNILVDLISVLSAAVADLIYIIQPNAVVIGGFLSSLPGALYDQLETAIRSQLPSLISNNLIIQQGTLTSQNSAAAGAVQYFLQNYLTGSGTDLLQMPPSSPATLPLSRG